MRKLTAMAQQDIGHFVTNEASTKGHVAISDGLRKRDEIGLRSISLEAKQITGPTKATNYLVRNKQDIALIQNLLNRWPIGIRRNDDTTGTLNRLSNERCDIVLAKLINFLRQLVCCPQPKLVGTHIATQLEPVRLLNVSDVVQPLSLLVHGAHAAQRRGCDSAAVVGIFPADN